VTTLTMSMMMSAIRFMRSMSLIARTTRMIPTLGIRREGRRRLASAEAEGAAVIRRRLSSQANTWNPRIDEPDSQDDEDDPYSGNVLKAMVIQMRIMENHQKW
jgi:hypothetical protein